MKVYTRTGDDGTTSLVGGERIEKHSLRIEAYGTVDELISWIGLLRSAPVNKKIGGELLSIQDKLMHCAALLAVGKGARVDKMVAPISSDIEMLEKSIDSMEATLKPLTSFILPGGETSVANIHIARTVCRRAERCVMRLNSDQVVDPMIIKYINRLSDYLFVLSRKVADETGIEQEGWKP